jgi:hypothetical protein
MHHNTAATTNLLISSTAVGAAAPCSGLLAPAAEAAALSCCACEWGDMTGGAGGGARVFGLTAWTLTVGKAPRAFSIGPVAATINLPL